jgi:hypothetical protein
VPYWEGIWDADAGIYGSGREKLLREAAVTGEQRRRRRPRNPQDDARRYGRELGRIAARNSPRQRRPRAMAGASGGGWCGTLGWRLWVYD